MSETQPSPSEQTPLIAASAAHDPKTSVSFLRGLGIITSMGILIFIQSQFLSLLFSITVD